MSGEPALIEMQLHFCADTYIDEIVWRTCPKRVAPRGGVRQSLVSRRRRRRRRKGWLILMTATATRWCRAMSIAATSQQPTIARRGCYCGNTTLRCRPFQGLLSGKCQASAAVAEGLIFGVIVGCHCVGLFALVQLLLLLVWGVEWAFWICAPIMSRTDLSGWFCCTTVAGGVEFHLSETRFTRVESCD